MTEPGQRGPVADPNSPGPLSREAARALLDRGAELIAAGDFARAADHYRRVVGFDDPEVTAAALLGLAQARYRMDDEAAALATWEAILELAETPSTYHAWREVAAARVRDGDLNGAIAAYREADRRAPPADKAEIANRLGWLAKETGNVRASRRYFARGRGDGPLVPAAWVVLGVTVAVSVAPWLSAEGALLLGMFALDKPAVAAGEVWRLWTVTLVHDPGNPLHLFFNMYALYLAGPIVERLYGPWLFLLFYLLSAAGGSIASFALSSGPLSVGASGAIFGLFGVLLLASRTHHPELDRRGRALVSQLGTLLVINVLFGIVAAGYIDNAAHAGGFAVGAWLGLAFVPGRVRTLRSFWTPAANRPAGGRWSALIPAAALVVVAAVLLVGYSVGLAAWS